MELLNASLIDWSRAQIAMTAMYHWLFVPLTLGLGVIMAIMETMYVRTGNEQWKKTAKFWMVLFGINFAIGVATGIILNSNSEPTGLITACLLVTYLAHLWLSKQLLLSLWKPHLFLLCSSDGNA